MSNFARDNNRTHINQPYNDMKYLKVTFSIDAPQELLPDACDLLADAAGGAGFETFENTPQGLDGYVQASLFDTAALDAAMADFPMPGVGIAYTVAEAEDKDWNEAWENEGFDPITVGGRCVIHDGRHLPAQKAEVEIEIDARLAFGTGNHETTRMMATALMATPLAAGRVLDAGCGTGILGILALKLGAACATGYDIDEWSVDNARHNAVINGVDGGYEALLGDASVVDGIEGGFDVVAANINRNILLADMGRWAKALRSGGRLVVSGFYVADKPALEAHAQGLGLAKTAEADDNGWACLTFSREG